jgi:hypothetical protein
MIMVRVVDELDQPTIIVPGSTAVLGVEGASLVVPREGSHPRRKTGHMSRGACVGVPRRLGSDFERPSVPSTSLMRSRHLSPSRCRCGCARCHNPDPAFWNRCPVCTKSWQLGTAPCKRCGLSSKITDRLSGGTGNIPDSLKPLQQAFMTVERPPDGLGLAGQAACPDALGRLEP